MRNTGDDVKGPCFGFPGEIGVGVTKKSFFPPNMTRITVVSGKILMCHWRWNANTGCHTDFHRVFLSFFIATLEHVLEFHSRKYRGSCGQSASQFCPIIPRLVSAGFCDRKAGGAINFKVFGLARH